MFVLTIISVGDPDNSHSTVHATTAQAFAAVNKKAGNAFRVNATATAKLITGTLTSPTCSGVHQAAWYFTISAKGGGA